MPLELQVIRASEFIQLDPSDLLDFEASRQALGSLAQACRTRGLDCALLDLRHIPVPLRPQFTATELAALVTAFHDAGFSRRQQLAILYHLDVHGGIRDFAFISRVRGLRVRAFTDYETAMLWLTGAAEEPVCPGAVPVPIKKGPNESKQIAVNTVPPRTGRQLSGRSHGAKRPPKI